MLSADSVYIQCQKNITNFFPENIDYCSISLDKLSCFDKIYQSNDTTDLMMMRKMNMRNFKANYLYLCSYNDFIKEKLNCFEAVEKCVPGDCSLSATCLYGNIKNCSLKYAMIVSKTYFTLKSNVCLFTNEHFKLKPFYGPEMHCYPALKKPSGNATVKLGENYEYFCKRFDRESVFQCIEKSLADSKADLADDNYISKAKDFFRQRSEVCLYFSSPLYKTCSSVDVLSCQRDLSKTEALRKPYDELLSSYATCVYDKYKTCDETLAKTIKYNLEGISKATKLSLSFLFLVSQVAIILSQFW